MKDSILKFLRKLLGVLMVSFLFLLLGEGLGFRFGLDISFFFYLFLILFLILNRREVKKILVFIYRQILEDITKIKSPFLFLRFLRKYLEKLPLPLVFFGVLFDIFIFDSTRDLVILFLTGLWILTVWLNHFEGRISVAGGLLFLATCPFLLIFGKAAIAEKFAIWAYMFLVVGIGQMIIEYVKEERRNTRGQK